MTWTNNLKKTSYPGVFEKVYKGKITYVAIMQHRAKCKNKRYRSRTSKEYPTAREAAIGLDKFRILHGQPPYILKLKS